MSRVLIADDFFIRDGIKNVLRSLPLDLCGEVTDIGLLPDKIMELQPDILLFETLLCKQDAKKVLRQVKADYPQIKILIISDCVCDLAMLQFIRFGMDGFIRKKIEKEDLFKAIHSVSGGDRFYSNDIKALLANARQQDLPDPANYSSKEIEVLQFICKGRNNEQIADILSLSEHAVAAFKKNVMQKANVKKTVDLIHWAFENGFSEK